MFTHWSFVCLCDNVRYVAPLVAMGVLRVLISHGLTQLRSAQPQPTTDDPQSTAPSTVHR